MVLKSDRNRNLQIPPGSMSDPRFNIQLTFTNSNIHIKSITTHPSKVRQQEINKLMSIYRTNWFYPSTSASLQQNNTKKQHRNKIEGKIELFEVENTKKPFICQSSCQQQWILTALQIHNLITFQSINLFLFSFLVFYASEQHKQQQ
jgi:hypothetical protein